MRLVSPFLDFAPILSLDGQLMVVSVCRMTWTTRTTKHQPCPPMQLRITTAAIAATSSLAWVALQKPQRTRSKKASAVSFLSSPATKVRRQWLRAEHFHTRCLGCLTLQHALQLASVHSHSLLDRKRVAVLRRLFFIFFGVPALIGRCRLRPCAQLLLLVEICHHAASDSSILPQAKLNAFPRGTLAIDIDETRPSHDLWR